METSSNLGKHAQEIEKIAERFSLALKGANDGLWDWNMETDEIYYSPRWKSMLGFGENELEGGLDTWKKLVHPDDKDHSLALVRAYSEGKIDSYEVEIRMRHKEGHYIHVLSRAFLVQSADDNNHKRLVGTHVDITLRKKVESLNSKNADILKMIAIGKPASEVYDAIAMMYESRHPGMRCSMLELHENVLLHGGAPSMPVAYCEALHGLEYGPNVGSCGTSTFTGKRVIVDDIENDPKWAKIKHHALPHGLRSCWSEPIISSSGKVLGAFGMYYNHVAKPNEEESADLESAARLASIVMERDQNQKQIHKLAYTDDLTGLPSRAKFYINLEQTIEKSRELNEEFGLLYIDLDNFKVINDSLGHDVGDQLLKKISKRLQSASKENDFVGRLGGDEFCVLVNDNDPTSSAKTAEKIIAEISRPISLISRTFKPTCSIGIVQFPKDGSDLSSLFKAADITLYKAKENGKNQVAFYNKGLSKQAEYQFKLEENLKQAIGNNDLSLVYQPKINIRNKKIIGVEALLRWRDKELGQLEPVEFIAAAEKIGMIKELTEWVLKEACNQVVKWHNLGFDELTMAINISPNHLVDKSIVELLERSIAESGVNPKRLELEVVESVVQIDESNLKILNQLKKLGLKIAVDDFGSRYSYFASLKHLDVDVLKIDKYFVDDIVVDEKALILLKSMVEMGHNLGYEVTIEGVETEEQYEVIQKLNCQSAQGFLFYKPENAEKITGILSSSLS